MDNSVLVEEPLHGSNLIVGGTLGERAHQLYNEGYGKHMEILEIIFYVVYLDFLHTWMFS